MTNAVIETGGKQYHVKAGDVIKVDSLDGKLGDKVNFTNTISVMIIITITISTTTATLTFIFICLILLPRLLQL